MAKDHKTPRSKSLLIIPAAPIPREPFEILFVHQAHFVIQALQSTIILVSIHSICPRSIFVLCASNLENSVLGALLALCCHSVKVNCSNPKLDGHRMVIFPLLPLGFENHTLDAFKLLPGSIFTLMLPCPVQLTNIFEDLHIV